MIVAFQICCFLFGLSTLITSLEMLALKPFLFSVLVQDKQLSFRKTTIAKRIIYLQIFTSILILLFSFSNLKIILTICIWLLFLENFCFYYIRSLGRDGADQMRLIALGILAISSIAVGYNTYLYAIIFISIQTIISYLTSGISKLSSKFWRKGDALGKILNNYTYGSEFAANFLLKNKGYNKIMTYLPILFMLILPFSFLPNTILPLIVCLFSLFAFHLGASILMGLNDFLFTFPATYSCLIALHLLIHN